MRPDTTNEEQRLRNKLHTHLRKLFRKADKRTDTLYRKGKQDKATQLLRVMFLSLLDDIDIKGTVIHGDKKEYRWLTKEDVRLMQYEQLKEIVSTQLESVERIWR